VADIATTGAPSMEPESSSSSFELEGLWSKKAASAAMSPPQPDRRARMERARAANEAAARRLEEGQDLVGMSLRERMEMQRREREREGR